MMRSIPGLIVACALLGAAPAAAQDSRGWPQRAYVTIDIPFQPLGNEFSESVRVADAFAKSETDVFDARYASTRGPLFDAGAGVRIAGGFGVGVTASWFRRSADSTFDLRVPNPLVANAPRQLTGTVAGLQRREAAAHIQALYAIGVGKGRMMLSAGPTVVRVTQDLLRSIEFDEHAGFTAIAFSQAVTSQASDTAVGFNLGADLSWPLAAHVAVGSMTRYSRARVTLDPGGSTASTARAVELHAGGLQIGAGIRLLF
jgi:hypothetical protein